MSSNEKSGNKQGPGGVWMDSHKQWVWLKRGDIRWRWLGKFYFY